MGTSDTEGDDPNDYVVVMPLSELADRQIRRITVRGQPDAQRIVIRLGDGIFALSATCTHEGTDLGDGVLEGETIWCPAHNSGFNCRTGSVTNPPAWEPLATYRVEVVDGLVAVRVTPDSVDEQAD